jgi:hypothetical protein
MTNVKNAAGQTCNFFGVALIHLVRTGSISVLTALSEKEVKTQGTDNALNFLLGSESDGCNF